MGAFDKVIGYKDIKEELKQICDMFHNREVYDATGARFPKGILLHGRPGLGKTLNEKKNTVVFRYPGNQGKMHHNSGQYMNTIDKRKNMLYNFIL